MGPNPPALAMHQHPVHPPATAPHSAPPWHWVPGGLRHPKQNQGHSVAPLWGALGGCSSGRGSRPCLCQHMGTNLHPFLGTWDTQQAFHRHMRAWLGWGHPSGGDPSASHHGAPQKCMFSCLGMPPSSTPALGQRLPTPLPSVLRCLFPVGFGNRGQGPAEDHPMPPGLTRCHRQRQQDRQKVQPDQQPDRAGAETPDPAFTPPRSKPACEGCAACSMALPGPPAPPLSPKAPLRPWWSPWGSPLLMGAAAGDAINLWGAHRSLQGAPAAEPAASPVPREPHGATLGWFIAGIAARLLGFAGCGPGSLIPPIIYLIQTLCCAAVIAGELPCCLTINISSGVPGTRLCRSRPHRVARALSRTLAAAAPETCAQRVRVSGCDTPHLHPVSPPGAALGHGAWLR